MCRSPALFSKGEVLLVKESEGNYYVTPIPYHSAQEARAATVKLSSLPAGSVTGKMSDKVYYWLVSLVALLLFLSPASAAALGTTTHPSTKTSTANHAKRTNGNPNGSAGPFVSVGWNPAGRAIVAVAQVITYNSGVFEALSSTQAVAAAITENVRDQLSSAGVWVSDAATYYVNNLYYGGFATVTKATVDTSAAAIGTTWEDPYDFYDPAELVAACYGIAEELVFYFEPTNDRKRSAHGGYSAFVITSGSHTNESISSALAATNPEIHSNCRHGTWHSEPAHAFKKRHADFVSKRSMEPIVQARSSCSSYGCGNYHNGWTPWNTDTVSTCGIGSVCKIEGTC